MRSIKLMCLAIVLLALMANDSVLARGGNGEGGHGHGHGHLNLGINLGGYIGPEFYAYGGYGDYSRYGFGDYGYGFPSYYSSYYAYPPIVIMPSTTSVVTQVSPPQPAQPPTNYWHYCQNADSYYPYVKTCPGGWLQVVPQPPAQ